MTSTIITRKGLECWGGAKNLPADLAAVEIDHDGTRHVVTWPEVMRRRRERQAWILERKRGVEVCPWRAVRVMVAYFGNGLMGGWQAFIDDWCGQHGFHSTWVDRDGKGYIPQLMALFPLLLPGCDWHDWKQGFARRYARRRQLRQPVGVAYLWRRGYQLALRPAA